jgi:NAD(P)-dependent dehydrogenase (short-subunit alcohol dehydrogenase family)
MHLVDKVAIVTGGAMGNGRAIALGLAREGANVVVPDIELPLAEKTCQDARNAGRQAIAIRADVSSKTDVDAVVQRVLDEFGHIDILVNNAGVTSRYDLLELPEGEWDRVLDINLKGVFLCTQAAARAMVRLGTKGKIINISSVAATRGVPFSAHYSASKAGVELFTQAAARALAPHSIYVNAVAPGVMETPLMKPYLDHPEQRLRYRQAVPLGRIGQPEDLVGAVVFLASPASDFVTGAVLRVDGGALA